MYFQIKTSAVLLVFTVLDLCSSVPNLARQTKSNRKHFLINSSDERLIGGQIQQQRVQSEINKFQLENDQLSLTNDGNRDFLITNKLSDGEIERRLHFNGITAKEKLISNLRGSLALWQISYRETFLQMIYMYDGEIMDCDYLTGQKYNEEFVQNFYNEIKEMKKHNKIIGLKEELYHMPKFRRYTRHNIPEISMSMDSDNEIIGAGNLTYHPLFNKNDLPKDLLRVINFERMKLECEAYHQNVMRHIRDLNSGNADVFQNVTEHLTRKKRALSDWLIAPNTKWCGRGQTAEKYSQLGGASKADKCCRRHDHCKFNIYAMTTKWRLFNYRPFTISHCSCDMREKTVFINMILRRRDLTNFLRVPGTKWCGKGYSAKKYAELGGRSKADRCCRQHDKSCPFWIMGFETKYGLFNWRINTLMHCKCDDRY